MTELTITPNTIRPPPSLAIFTFITCEVEANFSLVGNVESQWILPNGTLIRVNSDNSKYAISQGPGLDNFETNLLINELIYSDSEKYTCEVRDIRDPDNVGDWISAQATLTLVGKL